MDVSNGCRDGRSISIRVARLVSVSMMVGRFEWDNGGDVDVDAVERAALCSRCKCKSITGTQIIYVGGSHNAMRTGAKANVGEFNRTPGCSIRINYPLNHNKWLGRWWWFCKTWINAILFSQLLLNKEMFTDWVNNHHVWLFICISKAWVFRTWSTLIVK